MIYRRGGLGDTLFLFPAFELLTKRGFEVHAVGNTDYLKLAKHVGWVSEVYSELPELEKFSRRFIFSGEEISPFPSNRKWIVEHYLESVGLNGEFSSKLPIAGSESSPFRNKVAIHPSSGSPKKNPPLDFFFEIEAYLSSLGVESLYILGEAESHLKDKLPKHYPIRDILEFSRDLASASLYIGLDSGVSHLASYLGVRSLIVYGPTDSVVWKPLGENFEIVSLRLDCAPCFPNVCIRRDCLSTEDLLKLILPRIDHILVQVHEDYLS